MVASIFAADQPGVKPLAMGMTIVQRHKHFGFAIA